MPRLILDNRKDSNGFWLLEYSLHAVRSRLKENGGKPVVDQLLIFTVEDTPTCVYLRNELPGLLRLLKKESPS